MRPLVDVDLLFIASSRELMTHHVAVVAVAQVQRWAFIFAVDLDRMDKSIDDGFDLCSLRLYEDLHQGAGKWYLHYEETCLS